MTSALLFIALAPLTAQQADEPTPAEIFGACLQRVAAVLEPAADDEPTTLSAEVALVAGEGLPDEFVGRSLELAYQAPDRLRLEFVAGGDAHVFGRAGDELWMHVPAKGFGVIGRPGVPRFRATPEELDTTELAPFALPLGHGELMLLSLLFDVQRLADEEVDGAACMVVQARPRSGARERLHVPEGALTLWVRRHELLPARLRWDGDGDGLEATLELRDIALEAPWPDEAWELRAGPEDRIETTAVSHLVRFVPSVLDALTAELTTLGPATGERRLIATHGRGRLEELDGTKVLYLEGSPEEMGTQHGTLMRAEVNALTDRVLYGYGVGTSFDKGRWFFGEIQDAQARLQPHVSERYLREMDAMAVAAGLHPQEGRLANLFPELFHCSGFALYGAATADGSLYHGRVLDYLRGIGLEQCAVVIVHRPDEGYAWLNVGYAGFTGTVTAMNEKRIAVGEMGGRGEGQWDGKPMAQLLREVMERAESLDEAIAILREGPRTCEYYYVLSDGNSRRAVGVAATPDSFELIWPGESHPQLPHAIEDTVLMSAGDRYQTLVERVRAGYGEFDTQSAIALMRRPVCMTSNIHNALFAPETLEVWVANADDAHVAAHTRYTRYDLAELLERFAGEVAAR